MGNSNSNNSKLQKKRCLYCRADNPIDQKRCFSCGASEFTAIEQENPSPPQPVPTQANIDPFGMPQNQTGSSTSYNTTSSTPTSIFDIGTYIKNHKKLVSTLITVAIIMFVFAPFFFNVILPAFTNAIDLDSAVLSKQEFISKAQAAGYEMEIEDDYDGFGTYWAGAHKIGNNSKEPIYTIDYTVDTSVHNAEVEYNNYCR